MKEEDDSNVSRVERSLQHGYWHFPLEPTSDEICAALKARSELHFDDGYPPDLVTLNRFFVMHKVGYRNGKGVKLEGWKTYDDHLMTKTSSGPLNGNENLVLRIFALRPVTKGIEPIKLCWVKELSKGHQSGRRKKFQPDPDGGPQKKSKLTNNSLFSKISATPSVMPSEAPVTNNLHTLYNAIPHKQDPHPSHLSPLPSQSIHASPHSPHSPHSPIPSLPAPKFNMPSLPGLHVTLAGLSGSLPPFQLPSLDVPASRSTSSPPPPRIHSPRSPRTHTPPRSHSPPPATSTSTSTSTTSSSSPISAPLTPPSSITLKSEPLSPSQTHRRVWEPNPIPPPPRSSSPTPSNTSFILPSPYLHSPSTPPNIPTAYSDASHSPPSGDLQHSAGGGRNAKQRNSRDAPFSWNG